MTPRTRLLLVEDHDTTALGLKAIAKSLPGFEVTAVAADGEQALLELDETRPDVACVDLGLPGKLDGYEVCRALRERHPSCGIVLYTGHEEASVARRARDAGVTALVSKSDSYDQLIEAFKAAADGEPYTSQKFLEGAEVPDLSPRQQQVLELLAKGKSNAQIAVELEISAESVKTHTAALLGKLEAHARTEAVAIGLRLALID